MIQMIVTDLDGTLLHDTKCLSAYTLAVLAKCRQRGVKVLFATARGDSAFQFIPPASVDGYVRDNGALAYADGSLCYKKLIDLDTIRPFLRKANLCGYRMILKANAVRYANFSSGDTRVIYADFDQLNLEMEEFYMPNASPEAYRYVKDNLPPGLALYFSRDNHLMVTNAQAVKPLAVAAVARHWGISARHIVAFGDDTNDIAMLHYVGVGVAMGNALEPVKQAADFICAANNDDGVAKWLEEHVLNGK